MELKIINPICYEGWDGLVLSSQKHSIFSSSIWARVLSETYRYQPFFFVIFDEGELEAFIPVMEVKSAITGKRGVSLPFSDYVEPFMAGEKEVEDVFDLIVNYGKKARWKYIEIRGTPDSFKGPKHYSRYYRHLLELSDNEDQIYAKFKSSTKRNIQKSLREGVEISVDNSIGAMEKFYQLNCKTRRRHGLPPQPKLFFRKVHEHICSNGKGIIVLALYNGEAIAGSIFFHFGEQALYKYSSSNQRYQHLRHNNLVMWEAIRWYSKRGCKSLCMGRTEIDNGGLRKFKLGWGTVESIISYYRFDLRRNCFVTRENGTAIYTKVLKNMPVALLAIIGRLVYRHVG